MARGFRIHDGEFPHFVTSTTIHWIPVFNNEANKRLLAESLTYCAEAKGLRVHAYVVMPDHFHAILSTASVPLGEILRDLKGYTSRELLRALQASHRGDWLAASRNAAAPGQGMRLWQPGVHPEQIHSPAFYLQKMTYIHQNPVRAGFVTDASAWTFSSAAFYESGVPGPVPVTPLE